MQPTHRMCPAQHADLLQRSFILEFYGTCYKYQLATCDVSQRKGKAQRAVQITWKHPPRAAVGLLEHVVCLLGETGGICVTRGTLGPSNKETCKGTSALLMQFPDSAVARRLVLS